MTPELEVHHHHPHRTGHRLIDLAVPVSAILLSVISLVIGIHHGHTMQEMAKANARLVQVNSWPLLQYSTGNTGKSGERQIAMNVENAGVGPAKIVSLELFYKGQPIRQPRDLARELDPSISEPSFLTGPSAPMVLRAGDEALILAMKPDGAESLWDKLNKARFHITFRACYCSVFDECWMSDLVTMSPQPVEACKVTPDSFLSREGPAFKPL